jgi:hypothetical protein
MSWIDECFAQARTIELRKLSERKSMTTPAKHVPAWQDTWDKFFAAVSGDVSQFNRRHGQDRFGVTPRVGGRRIITIVPDIETTEGILATTVLQVDDSGTVDVTQPPAREGIGRRGKFQILQDHIVALPNFTGDPKPPTEPMTPEEFSEFVLKSFLFPTLK